MSISDFLIKVFFWVDREQKNFNSKGEETVQAWTGIFLTFVPSALQPKSDSGGFQESEKAWSIMDMINMIIYIIYNNKQYSIYKFIWFSTFQPSKVPAIIHEPNGFHVGISLL